MGTGTWQVHDLLSKVAGREFYIRTRPGLGTGRVGRGQEYSSYLQALRDGKNEEGSQHSSESETSEVINFRFETIKNPTALRKEFKMEKEIRRNSSASLDWRQFIENTQKNAEALSAKNGDPIPAITKAALMASVMLEKEVSAHDISIMSLCLSLAKVSEDRMNPDLYRDVILSSAHTAQLSKPVTGSFADLRVMSDLANQMASIETN
jgi:hypothetical protein